MIVRIAHLSDTHIDETRRLEDTVEVLSAFVAECRKADVDLIVHSGDVFTRKSTPRERIVLANFVTEAADVAPVFGVKGNHDAPGDLVIFNHLRTRHPVTILERPTSQLGESPVFQTKGGARVGCIGLPWFDKAHLVAGLEATVDQEASRLATIEAAKRLLFCLGAEAKRLREAEGAIPILVGHVMVAGSEVSSGQTICGITVELSPHDLLEIGASYAAIGHVHKTQEWGGGRLAYAGSTERVNLGEPEEKGFRLVQTDGAGHFENIFVPLPARKIHLVEWDMTEDLPCDAMESLAMGALEGQITPGALVRFRYRVKPEDLHLVDEVAIERALREAGAHEVKVEAVLVHEVRVRSGEIVTAQSTWEKVLAFWAAKGIDPDTATRERVRMKLAQLEQPQAQEVAA